MAAASKKGIVICIFYTNVFAMRIYTGDIQFNPSFSEPSAVKRKARVTVSGKGKSALIEIVNAFIV